MSKMIVQQLLLVVGATMAAMGPARAKDPQEDYLLSHVSAAQVTLNDGFWQSRLDKVAKTTVPHLFRMMKQRGYMTQLKAASGVSDAKFPAGFVFFESDFYKSIEAAAHLMKLYPDPEMEKRIDEFAKLIAKVQFEDGYLNWPRAALVRGRFASKQAEKQLAASLGDKYYINNCNLSHELYCQGHFIEAAVAYYEATGKRNLLDIAVKIGDHLDKWFSSEKNRQPSGHQEIELALIKLYNVTGDRKYLNLARMFLDERGHYRNQRAKMGIYGQDHKPVVEQTKAVGHVVRGAYMYSGMVDVSALSGDMKYFRAAEHIWSDAVSSKMYLTGGFGVPHMEGFPEPYELPNVTAYCESCGSVAGIFWADRLFRLNPNAKYYDVIERTLYNALLGSISWSGDKFNYTNPLASKGEHFRREWHGCACCPPNIARMLAQLPVYIYCRGQNEIYVNLFVASRASIELRDTAVSLTQQTQYPWQGKVRLIVEPEQQSTFEIKLRVPGWARNQPLPSDLYNFLHNNNTRPVLLVNGKESPLELVKGYATLKRFWRKGDVIELDMPMPVRRLVAHPKVVADARKVALQRGPLVYCLEGIDNSGHVLNAVLKNDAHLLTKNDKMLGGIVKVTGEGLQVKTGKATKKTLTAIPYYAWNNRGRFEMTVFIANKTAAAGVSGEFIGYDFVPLKNKDKWIITTSADRPEEEMRNMVDNHSTTVFTTGRKQSPDTWLQVELPQLVTVDVIHIDSGSSNSDYARGYEVLISANGKQWRKAAFGKGNTSPLKIKVDRAPAKFFKIVLTEEATSWWTVAELNLCRYVD